MPDGTYVPDKLVGIQLIERECNFWRNMYKTAAREQKLVQEAEKIETLVQESTEKEAKRRYCQIVEEIVKNIEEKYREAKTKSPRNILQEVNRYLKMNLLPSRGIGTPVTLITEEGKVRYDCFLACIIAGDVLRICGINAELVFYTDHVQIGILKNKNRTYFEVAKDYFEWHFPVKKLREIVPFENNQSVRTYLLGELAAYCYDIGNYEFAIQFYEGVAQKKQCVINYMNLAFAYAEAKKLECAFHALERGLQKCKNDPLYHQLYEFRAMLKKQNMISNWEEDEKIALNLKRSKFKLY